MNAAIVVIEIVVMAVIGTISFLLFFSEDNTDDLATTSSGGGVVIRSGVALFDLFDDVFFAMLASAGSILTTPKDAALETVAISDNKQRSRFIVMDGYDWEVLGADVFTIYTKYAAAASLVLVARFDKLF